MSRQILFNNVATVPAAGVALGDIDEGRIYAFDVNDFSESLDLTAPVEADAIQFVQGGKDGRHVFTSIINVADVKDVTPVAYAAQVDQVSTVTCAANSDEGAEAVVRVVETNSGFKPHKRVTASVLMKDKTPAQLATALAAIINKRYPKFVNATTDNANLILTGVDGSSFSTSLDKDASGWTLVSTTPPSEGSGNYSQVRALEEEALGQQANFLNRIYLPVEPNRYAQNANYDLHTIRVKTNTTQNISPGNMYQELSLAVVTATAGMDLPVFFKFEEPSGT